MKSTFNIHAGNDLEADILKSTNMKSPKARFVLALGTSPLPVHAQLHPTLFKSRRGGTYKNKHTSSTKSTFSARRFGRG